MLNSEPCQIGRLRLADYNPRTITETDMANLVRSIDEFGFVEPVIARREDHLVIGGHQRIEAMRRLLLRRGESNPEAASIPVIFVEGITDERAKLLNLALNRIHGEWDYDKLGLLFDSLDALVPSEIALSGFSDNEIHDISAMMAESTAPTYPEGPEGEGSDSVIAADARRFSFEVEEEADARICSAALRAFGMTGPRNATIAFVNALKTALAVKVEGQDPLRDPEE